MRYSNRKFFRRLKRRLVQNVKLYQTFSFISIYIQTCYRWAVKKNWCVPGFTSFFFFGCTTRSIKIGPHQVFVSWKGRKLVEKGRVFLCVPLFQYSCTHIIIMSSEKLFFSLLLIPFSGPPLSTGDLGKIFKSWTSACSTKVSHILADWMYHTYIYRNINWAYSTNKLNTYWKSSALNFIETFKGFWTFFLL